MSFFKPPPKPSHALGWHRILSPTASVKVSPLALGGISIGSSWSSLFGKNAEPFALLDSYYEQGGNFIDTSNTYNAGESESLIGEWMEKRGVRDQMVIATKYTSGYQKHNTSIKIQTNYVGNSAKSMHLSVRDSLKKLRTDYVDILYVHWWDLATSVEEMMTHLHSYVMSRQVLYLGASDMPAWVVVKANAFARSHGLTPFSVYQGKWNASYRDMEAELVPMCEDQGMGIVVWAALGGGDLLSAEQRKAVAADSDARQIRNALTPENIAVCDAIEEIAKQRSCSFQAVILAYLFAQTTFVFPIVGVNSIEHVEAMSEHLKVKLTDEEIKKIHAAKEFRPQFPIDFYTGYTSQVRFHAKLTAADNEQYKMWAHFDAPPKQGSYEPHPDI